MIALVNQPHAAGKANRAAGFSRRHAKGALQAIAAELTARGNFARNGKPFLSTQIAPMFSQELDAPAPVIEEELAV